MRFGLFGSAQARRSGPDTDSSQGFRDFIENNVEAEALGYYSTFLVEHHFTGFGQVSASLNLLTWLGARTRHLRLGTAVLVLPWHNPVLLAEQAATLDLLSGGRLDFGIGKGYRWNEFAGFCIPMEEADARFEEVLEVITKAFTSETPFSHRGKYWQFDDIVVEPPTAQKPHPPFWMGAGSANSVRQVAERGYNMLLGQHSLAEEILEQVAQFRHEVEARGRRFNPMEVGGRPRGAISPKTPPTRRQRSSAAIRAICGSTRWRAGRTTRRATRYILDDEKKARYESAESALFGTPDEIMRKLERLRQGGVEYVIINFGGSRENIRRFARDIMPAFADEPHSHLGGKCSMRGANDGSFEFGVFHEFQRRPGQSEAEAFTTAFEQVDAAERWGLDAIWLAEIHMAPERSVCSVPMTIASAIAARTKNIKIGTGVQVLPLCQPLRLAEDAATVDHISHGRLIFGVGRSGFPRAYEAYGIPYGESPERFAEVLEIVKRAWTEEKFSFAGKYYNYENVCIVPKPYHKPHPPIRIAANREDTVHFRRPSRATRSLSARGAAHSTKCCPICGSIARPGRRLGIPERARSICAPRSMSATPSNRRCPIPQESLMNFYRYLGARLEESANRAGVFDTERRIEGAQRLQTLTWDEVRRGRAIVGTPEIVADNLASLRDQLGLAGILAELNTGGLIPHERVMRSMQLLCEKVQPRLH